MSGADRNGRFIEAAARSVDAENEGADVINMIVRAGIAGFEAVAAAEGKDAGAPVDDAGQAARPDASEADARDVIALVRNSGIRGF
jgi:hypothetical protein